MLAFVVIEPALQHIYIYLGYRAEPAAQTKDIFTVKDILGLINFLIRAENSAIGKFAFHQFKRKQAVIHFSKIGALYPHHVYFNLVGRKVIEQRLYKIAHLVVIPITGKKKIGANTAYYTLLVKAVRSLQSHVYESTSFRRGVWRKLEFYAHPAVGVVIFVVIEGSAGIGKYKEFLFIIFFILQALLQQVKLMVHHFLKARFAYIPASAPATRSQ